MTAQRLVVKLGTSTLTAGTPHLSPPGLVELVRQMAQLREAGCDVVVVSSGAIAAGRERLNFPQLPKDIPAKQMLAAVGQPRLLALYEQLFGLYGLTVAQVLLTRADLADRRRYLNSRNTLMALLAQRVISVIRRVLAESGLPADAVQFVDDPDRARVTELLNLSDYVDMIIPRGGAGLHQFCRDNSRIPVITGGIGICHLFVDESADLEAALAILRNAKVQRPTVCNALDTALIHRAVAARFLPRLVSHLGTDGVSFRADESAQPFLPADPHVRPAGPEDFDTEWLSLVLGLKVVDHLDEAMAHIAQHSTGHSDGILTRDEAQARRFVAEVDSAAVYVNASTRFTDGGQLGLGAEVAISTQRLHARGPMGLRELTTYKWVIVGDNHVRP